MRKLTKILWLLAIAIMIVPCYSISVQAANKKTNNKNFVVVIDAGHGGKDIGATDHGVKEKDINLEVAKKLGKLLEKKMQNVTVVYTRSKDEFLTLQQRADIANKANANIFVSIHTNSTGPDSPNRESVSGAEVYTLGPQKEDKNMDVARRENAVIALEGDKAVYQGFNPNSDESYIIFELAQKDNINNSVMLANDIQKNLVKVAGRKNRGVQQAGFWVLHATKMPSVLVELDFICNPEQAKYLSSSEGQERLAESIYRGIKEYRDEIRNQAKTKENKKDKIQDEPLPKNVNFRAQVDIKSTPNPRRVSQAPKASKPTTNAPRKRRNNRALEKSANRKIDLAVIDTQKSASMAVPQTASEKVVEPPTPAMAETAKVEPKKSAVGQNNKKSQIIHAKNNNAAKNKETKAQAKTETKAEPIEEVAQVAEVKNEEPVKQIAQTNEEKEANKNNAAASKSSEQRMVNNHLVTITKPSDNKPNDSSKNKNQTNIAQSKTKQSQNTKRETAAVKKQTSPSKNVTSTKQTVKQTANVSKQTTATSNAPAQSKTLSSTTASSTNKPGGVKNNNYYSVKLIESTQKIGNDDALWQSINGKVEEHKQDNKYIYTIGHYKEKSDTLPTIQSIKQDFPNAKAVRVNGSTKKIVQ